MCIRDSNNLRLKQAAGTLSPADLEALDSFLKPDYNPDKDFLPEETLEANFTDDNLGASS